MKANVPASRESSRFPTSSQSQWAPFRTVRSDPTEASHGLCIPAGTPGASRGTCKAQDEKFKAQKGLVLCVNCTDFLTGSVTFCTLHSSCPWRYRTVGQRMINRRRIPVSDDDRIQDYVVTEGVRLVYLIRIHNKIKESKSLPQILSGWWTLDNNHGDPDIGHILLHQ